MGGLFGGGGTVSTADTRIGTIALTQSTYGIVIPVVFGTMRIAANMIDYIDFTAIPHTTTTHSGKGGGGVTSENTTYTYEVATILSVGEGPISGIKRVWKDKTIYHLSDLRLTAFTGTADQQPWDYMTSKHGERALAYPYTAYAASPNFELSTSASMPTLNFEVAGHAITSGRDDAAPADIITAILTDTRIGVGFPESALADLSNYRSYCQANGIYFSPSYESQTEAQEIITDLLQASNSAPVWSQGKLKIIPYGLEPITANGTTYTPPQALYDITLDDIVYEDGTMPILIKPKASADRSNMQSVEFMNRQNDYNVEPYKATDDADISQRGIRPADNIEMHFITLPAVAQFAAQAVLQRKLYIPAAYEFTLSCRHSLLDPMDVITLTDPFLGLDRQPVRITSIEEDEELNLRITAEDCPEGVNSPTIYTTQNATRVKTDFAVSPGNVKTPIIASVPAELSSRQNEMYMFVCGDSDNWGGCNIWASYDNATYKQIGTIKGPSRMGTLRKVFASGDAMDTQNILSVEMFSGELLSGSKDDMEQMHTLCYVDNELLSYQTANLIAAKKYDIYQMKRGCYGTDISSHDVGSLFARIDADTFRYVFSSQDTGKKVWLKFTSFNVYGASEQSLADVEPYTYILDYLKPKSVTKLAAYTVYRQYKNGHTGYDIVVNYSLPPESGLVSAAVYYKTDHISADEFIGTIPEGVAADELGYSLDWKYAGESISQVIIPDANVGDTYIIKAVSRDMYGHMSVDDAAPTITVHVLEKQTIPNTPQNFRYDFTEGFYFLWDAVTNSDIDFYEVRLDEKCGNQDNLLGRCNGTSINVSLTNRSATVYLYAHNATKKYSYPATLTYNVPKPEAPVISLSQLLRGLHISAGAFPSNVFKMHLYITSETNNEMLELTTPVYAFHDAPGLYTFEAAYVDIFGEGERSQDVVGTIKSYLDPAWIEENTVTENMVTKTIKDALAAGTFSKEAVTTIVANLNKEPTLSGYSAITQLTDAVNLRVVKDDVINQINLTTNGMTIDGKFLHVTGLTQFDNNVIVSNMLQAGSVTADAIAAGSITSEKISAGAITTASLAANAVTAEKLNVNSLSAITGTIGTLQTATSGARVVIQDNLIQVYDANNVLRVRMGVW